MEGGNNKYIITSKIKLIKTKNKQMKINIFKIRGRDEEEKKMP